MKKIMVVDDSALMRRALCDIINADERFEVTAIARNGLEALELLKTEKFDAVVLDVNMPKMTGIELLKELQKNKIDANVLMASTDTSDGAIITIEALELGALDFIHKPGSFLVTQNVDFKKNFLDTLIAVSESTLYLSKRVKPLPVKPVIPEKKVIVPIQKGNRIYDIVAIASSTGGPRALQQVIPFLHEGMQAPLLIVQHMPPGFTKSFADRLDTLSKLKVSEAVEGDILENGHVYLAMGGKHMKVLFANGKHTIHYSDEPNREGVKPSANYMYESLADSNFKNILCIVLTGMGADGTKGIENLHAVKNTYIIAQEEHTCAVYGMPKSIVATGLVQKIVPLDGIAQEINMNVEVR